jgi:hypothetical protein
MFLFSALLSGFALLVREASLHPIKQIAMLPNWHIGC